MLLDPQANFSISVIDFTFGDPRFNTSTTFLGSGTFNYSYATDVAADYQLVIACTGDDQQTRHYNFTALAGLPTQTDTTIFPQIFQDLVVAQTYTFALTARDSHGNILIVLVLILSFIVRRYHQAIYS